MVKSKSDDQRKAMFANINKAKSSKSKSKRLKRPKLLDRRSKRAIAIDKSKIARKRYNPLQVEEWKKDKGHSDLMGYDAVVSDPRSKRAIAIDRGKEADHVVQLDSKKGYARWKKNRNKMDLQSWDTHFRKLKSKILAKQKKAVKKREKIISKVILKQKKRGRARPGKTVFTSSQKKSIERYVSKCLGSKDTVDVDALLDSRLSYRENQAIISSVIRPTMRDIFPH